MNEFALALSFAVNGLIPPNVPTHVAMLATSILDVTTHRSGSGDTITREQYLEACGTTYDAIAVIVQRGNINDPKE